MPEQSEWMRQVEADPGHSHWYVKRFRDMAAAGHDLSGEARLVDAMLARGSRVLDAGCGSGRVGAYLHSAGHTVIGVDVDPALIAAAETDHPGPTWLVGDLAEMDLPGEGIADPFDVVVCAGNVMPFLAASTRGEVLRRLQRHLRPGGRAAIGFGLDRGYPAERFLEDSRLAGFAIDLTLSTWDLQPLSADSGFLVAILSRAVR